MPKKWLTKSPKKRKQLAAAAVLDLLPTEGSEAGWSQLKEKAQRGGMSSATLRAHLKNFVRHGLVKRRMDPSTYPPRVYYRLNIPRLFPMKMFDFYMASKRLDEIGDLVSKGGIGELAGDLSEATVKAHTRMLAAAIAALLHGSLGGKGPYGPFKGENLKGEVLEKYLDQLRKDVHEVADEQLDVVLRPWIHRLLDVAMIFKEDSVMMSVGEELMEAADKELKELNRILNQAGRQQAARKHGKKQRRRRADPRGDAARLKR